MIFWMLGGGALLMAAGFLMGYVWCDWKHAERAAKESRTRHQDSLDRFATRESSLPPRCGSYGCPRLPELDGICAYHKAVSETHVSNQ